MFKSLNLKWPLKIFNKWHHLNIPFKSNPSHSFLFIPTPSLFTAVSIVASQFNLLSIAYHMRLHQSHPSSLLNYHKPTRSEYTARHCDTETHCSGNATFHSPLNIFMSSRIMERKGEKLKRKENFAIHWKAKFIRKKKSWEGSKTIKHSFNFMSMQKCLRGTKKTYGNDWSLRRCHHCSPSLDRTAIAAEYTDH